MSIVVTSLILVAVTVYSLLTAWTQYLIAIKTGLKGDDLRVTGTTFITKNVSERQNKVSCVCTVEREQPLKAMIQIL